MLESIFGIPIKYEIWNKKSSMPLYIAGSYDFRTAYISDKRCIMTVSNTQLTLPTILLV